jgi:chorismate dehydratase
VNSDRISTFQITDHRSPITSPLNSLRIGCVKYLNARPLIHGWEGDVDFDHPSTLCNKLAAGKLDVGLVSSFEFLRNPIYRIVDDVSISSDGPVYSVVVAYRGEIAEIKEIELDPASETSANLLRCLIAERGLNPRLVRRDTAAWAVLGGPGARDRAQLLIGDQAIRFRQAYANEFSFWDLGEHWRELVGLPFVYALWLVRPEVTEPEQMANRLRALRNENLAHLDHLIEDILPGGGLSRRSSKTKAGDPGQWKAVNREFLSRYYREHLRFKFGEKEKEGLRVFANLCETRNLLPRQDLAFRVV